MKASASRQLHWERRILPFQSISIKNCSKDGLLKRASTAQHPSETPWTGPQFHLKVKMFSVHASDLSAALKNAFK